MKTLWLWSLVYAKFLLHKQRRYHIENKAVTVGEYTPDLIAFDTVVVDAKVIEGITDQP
jgi:hypothetical protein